MSAPRTVTFDDSPAGSWRRALDREGTSCAACRQNECGHSDMVYQGVMPPPKHSGSEKAA